MTVVYVLILFGIGVVICIIPAIISDLCVYCKAKITKKGHVNGREWIDLGLPSGTKWATCNIGSKYPADTSICYIWTQEYDTATRMWGDGWRMPTAEEFYELKQVCAWTLTMLNGEKGYLVTGPNGKSIFLPYTWGMGGEYWTSTRNKMYSQCAWYFLFTEGIGQIFNKEDYDLNSMGDFNTEMAIRPVKDKK